jgi:predicted ATPase/tRNA A-37 threonylcarbamoyl transferase component Bud32
MKLQASTTLAGRYRLERELGAGGMATVYLAEDVKHRRQVAVKVLHPELAAQLGHERFLREITTTANLRHPNILPLFDSGEFDGQVFYVMPFIEGETLRDRLTRGGTLAVSEALRIADEVADALSYAHKRGVIHRDIKPENILLENDHAIVADFGIAHAANAAGNEKLTRVGLALGTPDYMSPEQGSGETVDARSDLYALACVVYEMLAGTPPFTAPTPVAVLVRHAIEPVPSITNARPDLAAHLVSALERALAKSPEDRYATIQEWRDAIKRPGAPAATAFHKPPPTPATALLGREDALAAAIERVHAGARVLSITGYGGTGKTRFSIELFRRLESAHPGGSAFISLASVTAASEVLPTIGTALDIAEAHGRSALDAVSTVIGDRRALLVLDNLEQVLDAATDIAALVARCPSLQVIATSRAPLKIGAESEFVLPPLELPADNATLEAMRTCPSVALFLQRAEKVKPGFTLTTTNASAVSAICRQLDGLPLALELAAARVRILEPTALLQRLDHALDLLTSGDRDLPLRQRTLRATISWSYSLLDASEQRLLRRVSVFHEGWTLEAMEQVCYDEADRFRALDQLDSLVEKGLVRVVGAGERYALLETIRAFATEQLHASGELSVIRHAHADYFVAFAGQVDADIKGTAQVPAVHRARRDNANMHAAIQWLLACARTGDTESLEKGLLVAGYLNWFWHMGGQHLTGRVVLDVLFGLAALRPPSLGRAFALLADAMICTVTGEWERCLNDAHKAKSDGLAIRDAVAVSEAMMYIGYSHLHGGRMDEARAALDDAIARSAGGVNEFNQSLSMSCKGMLMFATGDLDAGMALVEESRLMSERKGDYELGGVSMSFLAQMTFAKGDPAKALTLYREALASLELVGDRPEIARVLCEMGWTALAAPDIAEASRSFQLAVRAYEEVGSPRGTGLALMGLAAVEAAAGRPERAVSIAAAADALSKRAGIVVDHTMDPGIVERIGALRASIPKGTLDGLVANARELTPAAVLSMVGGTSVANDQIAELRAART